MGTIVIVQANIKPELMEDIKLYLAEILPETRKFDGCRHIDVYFDSDEPYKMVMIEEWESRDHYKKYHAWRTETGVIDNIRSMIDGTANICFLNKIDI